MPQSMSPGSPSLCNAHHGGSPASGSTVHAPEMRERPAVKRSADNRAFVDEALADLRSDRWRPRPWVRFLWRCCVRSAEQARAHPRAALEVTVLHLGMALIRRRSRLGLAASWAMGVTHLGLLGPEARSIGPANALSLLRANLPSGRCAPIVAIGTDIADGTLARLMRPTAFGAYADPLADVVFWTRQVWTRENSHILRTLVLATWLLPVIVIGGAYFASGQTVDYPRPLLVRRLSSGLQCVLAARALKAQGSRCPSRAPRFGGTQSGRYPS
jgi:CDP-alcohol phosphatidyltransferase